MAPSITESALVRGREPVERFRPTSGAAIGWSGVVLALVVVGWVLWDEHSIVGARVVAGCLLGAVLVWMTQLRPRVTAYDDGLLMHGMVRDSFVPYVAIEDVVMAQTLQVRVHGRRYVCVGIGGSRSSDVRARVQAQTKPPVGGAARGFGVPRSDPQHGLLDMKYHEFVLERIKGLVARAKEHPQREEPPPVRHSLAVVELGALAVTAVALVVTLLL